MKHHLAHEDEERDGKQRKVLNRIDGVAHQLHFTAITTHENERTDQIRCEKREHHRQTQHHEEHELMLQYLRRLGYFYFLSIL